MTEAPSAFPLAWPPGWPRTPSTRRETRTFKATGDVATADGGFRKMERPVTVLEATDRLQRQVALLGGEYPVVSTNMELRRDGRPYSDGRMFNPDPGAALYFRLRGRATVMPCDRFVRLADNIAAIAAHIDAVRRIERYGVGTTEQMFAGFVALPPPIVMNDWRAALGHPQTLAEAEAAFQARIRKAHPDAGGTHAQAAALTEAIRLAREALR